MNIEDMLVGSVSVGLHKHDIGDPHRCVELMREQTSAVERAGFDGVTFSEHHLGYPGYFPNPMLAMSFALASTERIWAGPMPTVLALRSPALVIEDLSWLEAAYPNRVVAGFAAGNQIREHETYSGGGSGVARRFESALRIVAGVLRESKGEHVLLADEAVARARGSIPLISAARSRTAVMRAVELGMGLLLSPTISVEATRRYTDQYRSAGGLGACILIRRIWVDGDGSKTDHAPSDHRPGAETWTVSGSAESVSERLGALLEATGADAVNVRIHTPSLNADVVDEQIRRIGSEVLPGLRAKLGGRPKLGQNEGNGGYGTRC